MSLSGLPDRVEEDDHRKKGDIFQISQADRNPGSAKKALGFY